MKGCQTPGARLYWILLALFAALAGSAALVAAQGRGYRPQAGAVSHRMGGERPLIGYQTPAVDLRRINPHDPNALQTTVPGAPGSGVRFLAGGPAGPKPVPAPPPYIDLTTVPRPPQVGISTASHDLHPFYAPDQASIYIDSDRADLNGTTVGSRFHIYRLSSDGSQVTQITGTGNLADEVQGDQLFPAVNNNGTKLAYAQKPASPGATFQLYVLDLNTGRRTQLTGIQGQLALANIGRPSWNEGNSLIAFQAQRVNTPGDPFNIFTVNPITLQIVNVTQIAPNNSGVEAVDAAFHRVGNVDRVSFASTAKSTTATGGFNTANGTPGNHDIWDANPLGPSAGDPFQHLTSGPADDREPAWNRGFAASRYVGDLAFSSLGREAGDPTYDIFWISGNQLPEQPGTTPVHELLTPDNDPAIAASLRNQTDETSPSWSLGLNSIERIAYHANRIVSVNASTNAVSYLPSPHRPPVAGDPANFPIPGPGPADKFGNTGDIASGPKANRDVWESDIADLNPPTLLPFNEQTGEILRIVDDQGRKLGTAGATFHFFAKVKDIGSGVQSVWVQIKNPNSASQSADGQEHKLYGFNEFVSRRVAPPSPPASVTHDILENIEFDAEGVSAGDYSFYRGPQRRDFVDLQGNSYGGDHGYGFYGSSIIVQVPSYLPGVDDAIAWTGAQYPPLSGKWLQLTPVAGQPDVYGADWATPNLPSDFYVDLIAYDNAVDPLDSTHVGNWIIYDNVGGFSTQPLVEHGQALAVMDNALGQKWLRGARGAFRAFPTFRMGTESEVLDRGEALYTKQRIFPPGYFDATAHCTPVDFPPKVFPIEDSTVLVGNTFNLAGPMNFIGGDEQVPTTPIAASTARTFTFQDHLFITCLGIVGDSYPQYGADVWRVLAKGPVPPEVLADYLPTHEAQPTDVTGAKTRDQLVPEHMVIWHAPYSGDVFAGAGSILDLNTQTNLTNFVSAGGRLLVDGADVAWALTQDGADPNQPFLANVLDAKYGGDSVGGETTAPAGNALAAEIEHDIFTQEEGGGFNNRPVPPCPFGFAQNEPNPLITPFSFPPLPGDGRDASGLLSDAVPSSGIEPQIFPGANGMMDGISGRSAATQDVYPQRMIARIDPTSKAKVLYCGFNLSTMGRRYEARQNPACPGPNSNPYEPLLTQNYKEKLGHSIACWMLSASLVGQVQDTSGQAVSGALVTATDLAGNVVGTALTRGDGSYAIHGLPHGVWNLSVQSPGFAFFQKSDAGFAHALEQPRADLRLTPSSPGSISGTVTDTFGVPIPNIQVHAVLQASPLFTGQTDFFAVTDLNGNYLIPQASTGNYTVFIDPAQQGSFNNPQPPSQSVVVNSAQNTGGVNFTMTGLPAPLDVNVFESNNGVQGNPIPGAVVQLSQNGQPLAGFSGTTDANGHVHFDDVPAGPTTATASVPNSLFDTNSVSFEMPQTQSVQILLTKDTRPRGKVFGTITLCKTGQPVDPNVFPNLQVHIQQGGKDVQAPVTVGAVSASPVSHNFEFDNVPDDTYDFVVTDARFQPAKVTQATTAPTTSGITICLNGQPGVLQGFVKERLSGGGAGGPIANATVTITRMSGGAPVATLTTDVNGHYQTPGTIPSDNYRITATAFAFTSGEVDNVFVSGPTVAPDVLLARMPPVSVSGHVFSAVGHTPLFQAEVDLLQSDGTTLISSTFTDANGFYQFPSVPVGASYVVRASRSGFQSAQTTITVNPGQSLSNVDFVLQPAFVFQAGLQMVSLPDDYTNPLQDPKAVFGNPPGFKMAKFVPDVNRYVLYPNPSPDPSRPGYGADRLQSGYGEFVRFTQTTAFTTPGTPNTGPTVEVPLEAGWTIIGDPYSAALGFSQLSVRRSDGTVLTMQQALNAGVIFNDLLGWTGSGYTHHEQFLQPFKGYFVFAFQPVTLIMPNPATIAAVPGYVRYAAVSPAVRRLVEAVLPRVSEAAPAGAAGPAVPPFRSIVSGAAPWDGGFFAAALPERPRFTPALAFRKERGRAA